MKLIVFAILPVLFLSCYSADASPKRGRSWDALGTTFVVSVDWDTRVASADLRRHPANLEGAYLEHSMQKAVFFGSGPGCRMKQRGRVQTTRSKIMGILECSYEADYGK
jgi:hypothetical protein